MNKLAYYLGISILFVFSAWGTDSDPSSKPSVSEKKSEKDGHAEHIPILSLDYSSNTLFERLHTEPPMHTYARAQPTPSSSSLNIPYQTTQTYQLYEQDKDLRDKMLPWERVKEASTILLDSSIQEKLEISKYSTIQKDLIFKANSFIDSSVTLGDFLKPPSILHTSNLIVLPSHTPSIIRGGIVLSSIKPTKFGLGNFFKRYGVDIERHFDIPTPSYLYDTFPLESIILPKFLPTTYFTSIDSLHTTGDLSSNTFLINIDHAQTVHQASIVVKEIGERSTGQAPWYHCLPKGRVQAALAPCLPVLDVRCTS